MPRPGVRIGLKISLGCLAIAALVGVIGWLSAFTLRDVRDRVDALRRSSLLEFVAATEMHVALKVAHAAAQELVGEVTRAEAGAGPAFTEDAARAAAAIDGRLVVLFAHHAASRRATETALTSAEGLGAAADAGAERLELVWLDELEVQLALHRTLLDELVELARSRPQDAKAFLEQRVEPHYSDVLLPGIRRYREDAEGELHDTVRAVEAVLRASDRRNAAAAVGAGVLSILVGLLLTRSIARPLTALAGAVRRIGAGDLDARVDAWRSDEVGTLARAFNQMAERLQSTTVSKHYIDDIFHSMGEILLVSDAEGRIRTANRAAEEQLGWSERELMERNVAEIVRPAIQAGEFQIVRRDGTTLSVACTPTELHDGTGAPVGRIWAAQNIDTQKRIEHELRCLVDEKEVLLREVHHRVKNNLQVICSLLQLQAGDAAAPEVARRLAESEQRVRSMALIHEQLYRSSDLAHVDFRAYVEALAQHLLAATGGAVHGVALDVQVEAVPLDLDVAILCGLILNELLSNALKHAFPHDRSGSITVRFHQDEGRATLVVADDGVGLRAGDPNGQGSLGLRLIGALARQLGAEATVDGEAGTRVTIAFDLRSVDAAARAAVPA